MCASNSQLERLDFSCVVFDTAPTGHTLRLLGLPSLLKKNIEMMTKMGGGGLGPLMRNIGDAMGVGDVSSSEERIHFFKEMQETLQDPVCGSFH
jgi:arsenite/tail-anchored protein-transporting ATPase